MTTFVVIPYLLGIIASPNSNIIDKGLPEYTFQVDAKWWFSDFNHSNEHIYLSVDLKCHQAGLHMSCHLDKWNVRQQAHKGKDLILPDSFYIKRTSDQEALQRDSRLFQIVFSHRGVVGYYLQGNAIPRQMINLYRIIGNQLNIGLDIEREAETFEDMEYSNVGFCVVKCTKIMQKLSFIGPTDNLKSLVDFDLANNTITIVKQKNLSQCATQMRPSVAASFWPDLFPKTATSHVLTKSESFMTMSSGSFDTVTENEFSLYGKDNKKVGVMLEKVELYLKSYRLLVPDNFVTLNKDKIVFYKAANDETV